ncbi:uncharacterized protein [Temnothorax nylanderi]|uniref:uncharacterized protein isoform X2 n=1 Tax=Temnothorax nylanderi TaxID=102681 RepID=UPI003A88F7EC
MAKDFAVVTFSSDGNDEEEIVSEVPSLWLRSNLTECWWPSVKNINTFIVKQVPPVINDPKWSFYPIQFHGYYDSLDQARQKAMNYSSSDDSNINEIKKKSRTSCRKQLQKPIASESDTDSDLASVIPNPPNLTDKNVSVIPNQSALTNEDVSVIPNQPDLTNKDVSVNKLSNVLNFSTDNVDFDILEGTLVSNKSIQELHNLMIEMSEKMEEHFQKVYTALATVSVRIQDLEARLKEVEKQINQHKPEAPADLDILNMQQSLPLKSIDEITAFENRLSQNADEYNKFMLCISRIGGRSAKENLIRIYRTIFSNEVAKQSSWKGLRNHFKISSLNSILMAIQGKIYIFLYLQSKIYFYIYKI